MLIWKFLFKYIIFVKRFPLSVDDLDGLIKKKENQTAMQTSRNCSAGTSKLQCRHLKTAEQAPQNKPGASVTVVPYNDIM